MRSRLLAGLILTFLTLAFNSNKANAQITAITVDSFNVWSQSYCYVPNVLYINASGNVTGTVPANDSVTVYANYGDGSDTTYKAPILQNFFWLYWQHQYQTTGTYSVMLAVTTSNNITDTLYSSNFTFSNNCAPVSGTLYIDTDNDCTIDAGELKISGANVVLTNTSTNVNYYAWVNSNGTYSTHVPAGTYTVTPNIWNNSSAITPTCPASGTTTITVTSSGTYVNDFAYSCSSTASNSDVSINGWANNWRPGWDRPLTINATSNTPCLNTPGTITVTLDPLLTYSSTAVNQIPPTTVSGNVLTWNLPTLSSINNFHTVINVMCATTATMGDTLCVTAVITPATPDANAANNTDMICAPVNNSMDPNDKHVSPKGWGNTGNVVNGTKLNYLINFQNTGNDVAYDITIADTIDSDLDFATFKLLSSSHSVVPNFLPGNIIKFRFENINLPDSNSNEPASHGFVTYSIAPKANLPLGTQIKNTAHIYFDYNDAIVTNTTLNTIAAPQGIQHLTNGELKASVFPNPASNNIYVEVNESGSFRAELFDLLGRTVVTSESATGRATINVKNVPAGMYLLRLSNDENKVMSTKINVQH